MKTVKVVAAVICDSLLEKKAIFATARGYGEFQGQWEFPGGKVEAGEKHLVLNALVYCQNPTLNPALLVSAIERYLPELTPSFSHCARLEIYDEQEQVFR